MAGEGVHIVTVNDYLAKRDSEWMGKLYRFLRYSSSRASIFWTVGSRRLTSFSEVVPKIFFTYAADITYGTNNEFGFDYLRDNMALYAQELVQRGHAFAIVDEVGPLPHNRCPASSGPGHGWPG